jgi:signal transduction histidine kinase
VLLRDFLPLDLFFKIAFWWSFITVLELPAEQRGPAIRAFLAPALLSALGFYLGILRALWPLERYRRGEESDDALRAAARAAHRAPLWVALAATTSYSVAFLGGWLRLVHDTPEVDLPRGTGIAVLFIELTILLGASAFGYLVMTHNMARTSGALSLRLVQRGIDLPLRAMTLRRSNLIYGLGIGLSPVAMLTAMTVVGELRATRADGLLRARHAASALIVRLAEGAPLATPAGALGATLLDATRVVGHAGATVPPELLARGVAALAASADGGAVVDDGVHVLGLARGVGRAVAVALPDATSAARVYWKCWLVGAFMLIYAAVCARFASSNILLVVRRVARALREIAEAGGVAAGTKHIPLLARDELGVLVHSANVMIDRLVAAEHAWRDVTAELEQRVEERTAELRDSNRELEDNLKRLLEARSQLADAARAAGAAEVASSVLHNVGNVLNSVNVSVGVLAERLRASRAQSVQRAVEIVPVDDDEAARFFASDSRGSALPRYLRRVGEALVAENGELLREVAFLEKNLEHIKVIVALQQGHAKHGGLVEPLRVAELCDDALRFGLGSLHPTGLHIARELDRELEIVADRHRLFQIVVNLVRNARDAVREGIARPTITIVARRDDGHAIIEVIDNGCGITPENLNRIFNFGFTTKADGHGYGLHSSAVAAGELGGALGVHSDGAGRGATFALRLPCRPPRPTMELVRAS